MKLPPRTLSPALAGLLAACALCGWSANAAADPLEGTFTDAITGAPLDGAQVRALGTQQVARVDEQGRWALDLPPGRYEIELVAEVGDQLHRTRLVRQQVPQYKPAAAHVYTTWFSERGWPSRAEPVGLPGRSGQLPAAMPETIRLPSPASDPAALSVPSPIPRRIRVARRQAPHEGCRNNPIVAIEEMDLDEYVKGVLPPEIGVFQSIPGAAEVYKEFAIAAKSYGLWFMLFYDASNRRTVSSSKPPNDYTWFHIDDTACNQRYSDERLTITTGAAQAVANKILVKADEPDVLDKLEYAASCGTHGTLPEYGSRDALIPDDPPVSSCVGSWCGHDGCAAHEVNPAVPNEGRCLVRGICQWGSASWGEAGKDYRWMLDHYQPNLAIMDLGTGQTDPNPDPDPEPMGVELTGYVYTDPSDIPNTGVAGAQVDLSTGPSVMTNERGVFRFEGVDPMEGTVTLSVMVDGYAPTSRDVELVESETNWASVMVWPEGSQEPDMGGGDPDPEPGNSDPGNNDPGAPLDMGGSDPSPEETADLGPSPDPNTPGSGGQGPLGPLVTESPGIEGGGCGCAQQGARPGQLSLAALLGLSLLGLRRRER